MQRGEGIEVTGVHPYVRGERQRRIHWLATTIRGTLQVHQFAAERTADTVMLLDVLADVVDPVTGASSLDETFRAAAGLVRAYLRTHDRVGVVSVGGATRWLQPGSGQGYFYRIVESVLEVRKDRAYRTEGLSLLPPPALPEGALVYVITPLTDQRIFDILHQVRGRANPMVVVEIPTGEPVLEPGDTEGELALRLWRADRDAMRFALMERGIAVVAHRPGETLDLALAPLLRTRIHGGPDDRRPRPARLAPGRQTSRPAHRTSHLPHHRPLARNGPCRRRLRPADRPARTIAGQDAGPGGGGGRVVGRSYGRRPPRLDLHELVDRRGSP
ncbi:DUF58 domain-containing protein [Streptomyces kaempferi]